jgi:hypothetical protein
MLKDNWPHRTWRSTTMESNKDAEGEEEEEEEEEEEDVAVPDQGFSSTGVAQPTVCGEH